MSKENGASRHGPFGQGELNVYSALKKQVERLKPNTGLFGPEAKKFEKEKKVLLMEKEHELGSLSGKLPEWISPEGQYLAQMVWLALTEKAALPRSGRDIEIQHACGPVGVLASAIAKSEKYQEPKLEIHLTACPSYLDEDDLKKVSSSPKPIFVYEQINRQKVQQLHDWIEGLCAIDPNNYLVKGIFLHTPSPLDLVHASEFPGLLADFEKPGGVASAQTHWSQMEAIAEYCGLTLVTDVSYLLSESNRLGVDLKNITTSLEDADVAKFAQSQYIYDSYIKWGENAKTVLEVFYVGSVVGYGNPEQSFDYDNPGPLKLFVNCETGWGPETFAGAKTGVDFRHLLKDKGLHLALLIGSIQTPWAGKE